MAVTAFAGIPLSNKGLAEKVGFVQVASAAAFDYRAKLQDIRAALIAGGNAQDVRDLRTEISLLKYSDHQAVIDPLWAKIAAELESDDIEADRQDLFKLIRDIFALTYDPDLANLDAFVQNNKATVKRLARAAGYNGELTIAEAEKIANSIVKATRGQLKAAIQDESGDLDITAIQALLSDKNKQVQLVAGIINAIGSENNEIGQLINKWRASGVTVADLTSVANSLLPELSHFNAATKALAIAYVRTETELGDITTSSDGLTKTISNIKVLDIKIPANFLDWTKVSGNADLTTVNGIPQVKANSSTTVTLSAKIKTTQWVVLEKNLTLTSQSSGGGSGGGGGGASSPADQAVQDLNSKKAAIENATGEAKEALIKEAVEIASKALTTTLKFDASGKVAVSGDEATLSLTKSDLSSLTSGTKKIVNALKEVAPGAEASLPKLVAVIDIGSVSTNNVATEFSTDLVKELEASGITSFKISFSGFAAEVPTTAAFSKNVGLHIKKSAATEDTTSLPVASEVYEFGLTLDGQAVTEFAQPIAISIPLKNVSDLDTDLLTVAKIVDDKLQFVGGKVRENAIIAARHSFSSYVVVENKVSFNDISSVQAWSGRQIQVLAAKGIIQGKKEGVFAPADRVTRAEFAKMLVEALDLDNSLAKQNFSDVKSTDWFAPYVAAAAESGIINGRTATTFAPNATITRAEMATMVSRALKATAGLKDVEDVKAALANFSDAEDVHSTLQSGVALASSKGLIIGAGGQFRPNATANRAEAAVIIYRAFNYAE
nr:S-layer homology domain-containing protein [Paenibacillus roseus]